MRAVRAEALKLLTTRATLGLLIGAVAVVVLTVGSTVASADAASLAEPIAGQVFYLLMSINVGIFSLIVGMRVFTDDHQHGTLAHAYLADPTRSGTIVAKAAVAVGAAIALATLALAVMLGVGLPLGAAKGGELAVRGSDLAAFGGFLGANGLWALAGLAVGALVRHQTAAIVGGVVWVLVIENLGAGFLGDAGGYLPGQAAYAMGGALDAGRALAPPLATIVLALYAVLLFAAALATVRRRDA